MGKFKFRYRLSTKSSLAAIAKAVRELGYNMEITANGFHFYWTKESQLTPFGIPQSHYLTDAEVPEWLNFELEDHDLLAPEEPEP